MKEFIKKALPNGTILNGKYKYLIEEPLGQGSFGITYRARVILDGEFGSLDTQGHVAIKEFFMKDLNGRKECTLSTGSDSALFCSYLEKFRKEAVNLSNLHHPGIVKVIESFESNSTSYYVMEYISGGNLDEEIQRMSKFCFEQAYSLIADICSALDYMHEKGMLHLDLKPSNVMLDSQKYPILIDFGLSKHYTEGGEVETTTSVGLGTPGYAPIEQIGMPSKENLSTTMDVYALGGILFKMLTGLTPPPAIEIINNRKKLNESLHAAGIHDCVITLLEHCMHPFKDERIQSVGQFKNELDECYQTLIQRNTTLLINDNSGNAVNLQPCESNDEETLLPEQILVANNQPLNENSFNQTDDNEIIPEKSKKPEKEELSVKTDGSSVKEKNPTTLYRKLKWVIIPIVTIFVYILFEICSLYIRYDNFSFYSDYFIVRENNKEGVCNLLGFERIEPIYDNIFNLTKNLYKVEVDNKYGIVDDSGKSITEIIYDYIGFEFECQENLIPVRMNSKYGYIDTTGKTIIPFIYNSFQPFRDGLSAVKKDGKWGFINPIGETVIPFIYDDVKSFSEGFSQVKFNGKWGCIDLSGNEVIKPVYEDMDVFFSYGYKEVMRDGKLGFINEDWIETVPAIYDKVGAHNKLYASVNRDGKWGRVELSTGKELVTPIYEELGTYTYENNRSVAKVRLNGKYGYIDENWNEVVKPIYEDISHWYGNIQKVKKDGKYGLIDENFKEVLPTIYDSIRMLWDSNDEHTELQLNGKWGLINRQGEVVVKPIYDDLDIGDEGLVAVSLEGKYGYIDRTGKMVIPFDYDKARAFSNGLGNVKKDGLWGAVNNRNEIIISLMNDSITQMYKGYARIMRSGKWGRIDSTGTVTVQPMYDKIQYYHNSSTHIKRDGKWGSMDENWNIIVEPVYDEILAFSDSCFRARRNGYWGFVNRNLAEKTEFVYRAINSLDREYGLAMINKDNVWGLVNEKLDTVVNIKYDKIIQEGKYYKLYKLRNDILHLYDAKRGKLITNSNEIYEIIGERSSYGRKKDALSNKKDSYKRNRIN